LLSYHPSQATREIAFERFHLKPTRARAGGRSGQAVADARCASRRRARCVSVEIPSARRRTAANLAATRP
jgi:hypothetical protein